MKKHIFPCALILLTIIAWIIVWPKLPAEVPVHWGADDKVNNYASKQFSMIFDIGIMIFLYVVFTLVPRIDPKKDNYEKFRKSVTIMSNAILFVLFVMNMSALLVGLGYDIPIGSVGGMIVGLLFLIIGNYLPQCKPNYFIGIRTPWTLSNEEVWRKTHRFSGKVFIVLGIMMCGSIFAPVTWRTYIILTAVLGGVVVTMLYSYFAYKKEMRV
ncbi:Uncharacterized membrane protein [Bacillus sp. 491mf]|uniref:SdpI family protein n=1 Tax=Bacillus TaxID=1386 RepID=UPI0005585F58|nr:MULTISPECIES: SdpI family protein [unclassified Bacillus (in: firmicutes)]SFD70495.1 Uncharacterized membrane protein [Bacillus sp. 491mf]